MEMLYTFVLTYKAPYKVSFFCVATFFEKDVEGKKSVEGEVYIRLRFKQSER